MTEMFFLPLFNRGAAACWLLAAVMAVRLLCPRSRPGLRMALWAAAGLRLACPFSFESVLSLVPSDELLPQSELLAAQPMLNTGVTAVNARLNPVFTRYFAPEGLRSINPLQVWTVIAGCVWAAVLAALLLWGVVSGLLLHRRVAASLPLAPGVRVCDHIPAPFVLGLVRPCIYLPSSLPQQQYTPVIAHEKAHIARGDHWWKLLGFVLLAVYWFLPPVWLAWVLFCRDLEYAADARVTAALPPEEKKRYAEALLACSVRRAVPVGPLAFGEVGVAARIKAVLKTKKATLAATAAAAALCVLAVVLFAANPAGLPLGAAAGTDETLLQNVTCIRISTPQGVYTAQEPADVQQLCDKLAAVRLQRGELNRNRSLQRPSACTVSLYHGETDTNAVTLHFDAALSAVWADDGVKPGMTRRVRTAQALREVFLLAQQRLPDTAAYFAAAECLYRSPASSYLPQTGVSGFRYRISRDSFCFIELQTGNITEIAPRSSGFFAMDGGGWMPDAFDTPESWKALFPQQEPPLPYEQVAHAMALSVGQRHTLLYTTEGELLLLEGHREALSLYRLVPEEEIPA